MTLIRRTNPLGELISLRQAMDRTPGDRLVRSRETARSADDQPTLDIRQIADALLVDPAAANRDTSREQSA